MPINKPIILSVESSCDDTSAAVLSGLDVLSNVISSQKIHEKYGGVVPELASREHMANIVPTVVEALKEAKVSVEDLDGLAFTKGPGLLGSLLVGGSFMKGVACGSDIKLIGVNHMHAHILAHFLDKKEEEYPSFPFLCLTVSGGHTQIVLVSSPSEFKIIGETMDDAAGEAFDKTAKLLGLDYPGGPLIDKQAKEGDPLKFKFTHPKVTRFNYSFSGLKTNVLQFLQRELRKGDEDFIQNNMNDICASVQYNIISILLKEFREAAVEYKVKDIALAGGVSANSGLRSAFVELGEELNMKPHIPPFSYCTDNAAMVGAVAYFKYLNDNFTELDVTPKARLDFQSSF